MLKAKSSQNSHFKAGLQSFFWWVRVTDDQKGCPKKSRWKSTNFGGSTCPLSSKLSESCRRSQLTSSVLVMTTQMELNKAELTPVDFQNMQVFVFLSAFSESFVWNYLTLREFWPKCHGSQWSSQDRRILPRRAWKWSRGPSRLVKRVKQERSRGPSQVVNRVKQEQSRGPSRVVNRIKQKRT